MRRLNVQAKALGDRALVVLVVIVEQRRVDRVPAVALFGVLELDVAKLVERIQIGSNLQKALQGPNHSSPLVQIGHWTLVIRPVLVYSVEYLEGIGRTLQHALRQRQSVSCLSLIHI